MNIAIVGLSGIFPGCARLDDYWHAIADGTECIRDLKQASTHEPDARLNTWWRDSRHVARRGVLDSVTRFDAGLFGISRRDAEIMDPQQRQFLQCTWRALEDAAIDPGRIQRTVGVFVSASRSTYLSPWYLESLRTDPVAGLLTRTTNDPAYIPNRVSYHLGLTGPSVLVQSGASSSLAAVHLACQSLRTLECDIAIAGAVSISFPQNVGYIYEPGAIFSADGHCKPYSAAATGTVFGDGVAAVVLMRQPDAVRSRRRARAVVLGTGVSNCGRSNDGFVTPSVAGQVAAIHAAQAHAGITPGSIQYIEGHGTGTRVGDPIEVAALNTAYGDTGLAAESCFLGSVKANIGHLDDAAGLAGLAKTILMLENRKIPPSVWPNEPNLDIPWQDTPFSIGAQLQDWAKGSAPRRAAVNALGMGGTAAHVILQEADPLPEARHDTRRSHEVIPLSDRTIVELDQRKRQLANHIAQHGRHLDLASVAFTEQVGRHEMTNRLAVVCCDLESAPDALLAADIVSNDIDHGCPTSLAWMFPGTESLDPAIARSIYENEVLFRTTFDRCADLAHPILGHDIRTVMSTATTASPLKDNPAHHLVGVFALQYALALLLQSWGLGPDAVIGHGHGEYLAATVAGVFAVEDAIQIVAARSKLLGSLPRHAFLGVMLPEKLCRKLAGARLDISAVNGQQHCVVSGPPQDVWSLVAKLRAARIHGSSVGTGVACHSSAVELIMDQFREQLERIQMRPPEIRYVEGTSGHWASAASVTTPDYWISHLRGTVRFADGLATLRRLGRCAHVEIGLGSGLAQHARTAGAPFVVSTMPDNIEHGYAAVLRCVGTAWRMGLPVQWEALQRGRTAVACTLPGLTFADDPYDINAPRTSAPASAIAGADIPHQSHAVGCGRDIEHSPTPTETWVMQSWGKVLGSIHLRPTSNFLDEGGHSLTAITFLSAVKDEFGVDLNPDDLFRRPTVESLARLIDEQVHVAEEELAIRAHDVVASLDDAQVLQELQRRGLRDDPP